MIYEPLEKFVRLSQGLAVNKGTSYLFSDYKTDEFIYPLLRIVDLESGNHSTFSKYVSKDVSKSVVISEDTIVFSRVTCQCFRGFSGVVHNNLFVVEPINDFISKDYLFAILQSSFVRNQALNLAKSSVVPDLTHDMFKSIRIPIPDKSEQNKIVAVYQSISSKISNNNAIAAELEGMAKDLYDYWFVQFDFPDENGKPYKSSGGKMVWNEELKREIPEGWEISKASALLDVTRGISYSAKDLLGKGVAMINLNTFNTDSTFKKNGMKTYSGKYSDEKKVQPYDLLMCVTQQTDIDMTGRSDVIGKTFLMPNLGFDNDVVMSMDVAKLSCPSRWWLPFFHYLFQTFYAHRFITGYANGTKIKHLDVEAALNVPFVKASDSLVKQYANIALSISEKQSTIILENMELASLRDFLLPMLMNGQVKVKGA